MKKTHSLLLIAALIGIISCENAKEDRAIKGEEYFPLKVGDVKYYQVDSFTYNNFTKTVDTISHVIREEVIEKFLDGSNDSVYRVELSVFSKLAGEYKVFKSFERKINGNFAMEKLENRTEVKMLFPISSYKTKGSTYSWNTNMFNQLSPVLVKYNSVSTTYNNGIATFNNCVSVHLNKPQKGIINNIKEEVYSKDKGLVYRFIDSTDVLADTFPSGKRIFVRLMN